MAHTHLQPTAKTVETGKFFLGKFLNEDKLGIVDFKGNTINSESKNEAILFAELNKKDLFDFRVKFPAYLDADEFEIF